MATSSCTCIINLLINKTTNSRNLKPPTVNGSSPPQCRHRLFLRRNIIRINKPSISRVVVTNATPEPAADLLTSFSLTAGGIPGFSLPGDSPWFAGAAGLLVTVPLMVQRLLTLTKEVDMAAQTVEKIADAVEKVAEEVDKAAEDIADALPEGGLKSVVRFVEGLAEETAKDAQKVEDLMDKVEELDDKLEEFLHKNFKDTGKV